MAEFLGVVILIIFGNGVDCQVVLSANQGVAPSPKGVSLMQPLASAIRDVPDIFTELSIYQFWMGYRGSYRRLDLWRYLWRTYQPRGMSSRSNNSHAPSNLTSQGHIGICNIPRLPLEESPGMRTYR